ncbi:MAG: catechol-2,3-dioxygenase [Bacteriovoracaceae bacterium]|jgi:hypothetical protein
MAGFLFFPYNKIMNFRTVTLEAKDVPSTVSYLSELLELEILPIGTNEILLKSDSIEFKVVPGAKTKSRGNTVFDLTVNQVEDLEELSQKAQFLHYRYGEKCSFSEKFEDDLYKELELSDPDGRVWRFRVCH